MEKAIQIDSRKVYQEIAPGVLTFITSTCMRIWTATRFRMLRFQTWFLRKRWPVASNPWIPTLVEMTETMYPTLTAAWNQNS